MPFCQARSISPYCFLRFLFTLQKEASFTNFGNSVPLIFSKQLSGLEKAQWKDPGAEGEVFYGNDGPGSK